MSWEGNNCSKEGGGIPSLDDQYCSHASSEKRKRALQPLKYFKLQLNMEYWGEKGVARTVIRHVLLL
jgi:hypothetical protein